MATNTIETIRTTIDTTAINSISNGLNVICHMFPVVGITNCSNGIPKIADLDLDLDTIQMRFRYD